MSASLLPGNATPLERAFADILDTRSRYSGALAKVPGLPWNVETIPHDWLPWLILDEGLEELTPFLSPRKVLQEGRQWARERGSSAAIIRAMGWLDQVSTLHYEPDDDENFDLFQVELSQPVAPKALPDIIRLIELSKPTTDILARIVSGYDARPFRLDYSLLDGPDLLDDWSGVRLLESGKVVISFGIDLKEEAFFSPAISETFSSHLFLGSASIREGFVLDESRFDEERIEPAVLEIETIETGISVSEGSLRNAPWSHPAPWPGYAWTDFNLTIDGGWIASNTPE